MVVYSPNLLILVLVVWFLFCFKRRRKAIVPLIVLVAMTALYFLRKEATYTSVASQPPMADVQNANTTASENDSKTPQELKHMFVANASSNEMIAESSLCATTADADEEARGAAVNIILPYVKSALEPQIDGSPMVHAVATDEWLKKQVKSSLERGVGAVNKHVDRIERPYGTLWKETLQIDTSTSAIQNNFANPFHQLAEAQAAGKQNEWLTLAGLVGVIVLLYAFLNSATKGYFVWRLRAVATLVLIAAVLTIFAIA